MNRTLIAALLGACLGIAGVPVHADAGTAQQRLVQQQRLQQQRALKRQQFLHRQQVRQRQQRAPSPNRPLWAQPIGESSLNNGPNPNAPGANTSLYGQPIGASSLPVPGQADPAAAAAQRRILQRQLGN